MKLSKEEIEYLLARWKLKVVNDTIVADSNYLNTPMSVVIQLIATGFKTERLGLNGGLSSTSLLTA